MQDGGALFIRGDSRTGDDIRIVDHGGGAVDVACSDSAASYTGIARIDLRTGAGDDHIDYEALTPPSTEPADLLAHTGAGNDTFTINLQPTPAGDRSSPPPESDRPVFFDIATGDGDDTLTANLAAVPNSDLHFRADAGAGNDDVTINWVAPGPCRQVFVDIATGDGDDDVNINWVQPGPCRQIFVDIATGDGNDTLTAKLESSGTGNFHFRADTGAGNDTMTVNVVPAVQINGSVSIDLSGGAGDDTLIGMLDGDNEIAGSFSLRMTGGAGNDFLRGEIVPCIRPAGSVDVLMDGGAGDDAIAALLTIPDDTSMGQVSVHLLGGGGDDTLTLLDGGNLTAVTLDLLVDGGGGANAAVVSRGVRVVHCQRVIVVG